jgi:hypothetical protein
MDSADPPDLRELSDGIERLLSELRAAGPTLWPRIEDLVASLVQLYGAGLARVVSFVESDVLRARLGEDELVASLLALHGLHPLGPEARIGRALEEKVPQARLVEWKDGVARLEVKGGGPGLANALEKLVQEAAPEVTRVEFAPSESLLQIDLERSRTRARKGA